MIGMSVTEKSGSSPMEAAPLLDGVILSDCPHRNLSHAIKQYLEPSTCLDSEGDIRDKPEGN